MDLIKPKKRFIKSIFIYVPITTMQTSRTQDLTSGSITQSMLNLAYPLILGQRKNLRDLLFRHKF